MKTAQFIPMLILSIVATFCLTRVVLASNPLCPDHTQNCPTFACDPLVLTEFFCCSNGQSPAGNNMCCGYTCKRIRCLPVSIETMTCLAISDQSVGINGAPDFNAQCVQHSWGQSCVEDEENDPPGEG